MTRRSKLNLSSDGEMRSEPPTSFRAVDEQLKHVASQAATSPDASPSSRPARSATPGPAPRVPGRTSVTDAPTHQPTWLTARNLAKALLLLGAAALSIALLVRRGF